MGERWAERTFRMAELDDLYARIDKTLTRLNHYENDHRASSDVCIALSELVAADLDAEELAAVKVARAYRGGLATEDERIVWLTKLANRLDAYAHQGVVGSRRESLCRLAWATLVASEGLSPYHGEFLVELGTLAGLTPKEIEGALAKAIPGF
jgi:hypothetical protein